MSTYRPSRRAFTLLEGLLSIVIIAIIAALTLPVVTGTTDNYTHAAAARRATESVAFAMERAVRLLRDAPAGTDPNTIGIASASSSEVVFTDGTSLSLKGDQLMLTTNPADGDGVLLSDVEAFGLQFYSEDGVTDTVATPQNTHRFAITIRSSNAELRCIAFPRVRMVPQ